MAIKYIHFIMFHFLLVAWSIINNFHTSNTVGSVTPVLSNIFNGYFVHVTDEITRTINPPKTIYLQLLSKYEVSDSKLPKIVDKFV